MPLFQIPAPKPVDSPSKSPALSADLSPQSAPSTTPASSSHPVTSNPRVLSTSHKIPAPSARPARSWGIAIPPGLQSTRTTVPLKPSSPRGDVHPPVPSASHGGSTPSGSPNRQWGITTPPGLLTPYVPGGTSAHRKTSTVREISIPLLRPSSHPVTSTPLAEMPNADPDKTQIGSVSGKD